MVNALSLSLSLSLSEPPHPTGQQITTVHRYHSAQACCRLQGRVLNIDYSGAISRSGFYALDRSVLPMRAAAAVAFEQMDRALTLVAPVQADPQAWPDGTPPSVVIVREDQMQMAEDFNAQLGRKKIIRMAFLRSQLGLALGLVERIAG